MPTATFSGKITLIKPAETVGKAGTFKKRVFLLEETEGQYPNTFALEFNQDACSKLDNFNVNDEVKVEVEIRGRAYNDTAFNTLKAFRIDILKAAAELVNASEEPESDLPF